MATLRRPRGPSCARLRRPCVPSLSGYPVEKQARLRPLPSGGHGQAPSRVCSASSELRRRGRELVLHHRRSRTRVQLVLLPRRALRGSWSSTTGVRGRECSGVAMPDAPNRSRGNYCGRICADDPGPVSLHACPQRFGESRFSTSEPVISCPLAACSTKCQRGTRASNCIARRPEQQQATYALECWM